MNLAAFRERTNVDKSVDIISYFTKLYITELVWEITIPKIYHSPLCC